MLNKQVKAFRHWFFNFSVLLNFFWNILYIWIPKLYQLTRYDKTAFSSKFNFKTNFLEYFKPRWHFPMHYAKHPSCHAHLSWTNNDSIFDLFWSFEHMLLWKQTEPRVEDSHIMQCFDGAKKKLAILWLSFYSKKNSKMPMKFIVPCNTEQARILSFLVVSLSTYSLVRIVLRVK